MPAHYKSDKFTIKEIHNLKNKKYSVLANSEFTNGIGKTYNRDIKFYCKPSLSDSKKYMIYDSEGFCSDYNFNDEKYQFGIKTGCINPNEDKTDQQIAEKLKVAEYILISESLLLYFEIKSNISIKNWYWEYSYNTATGRGICINKSQYSIPKPRYKISYKDSAGNIITEDDGYITYDAIPANSSKSFSFYSGYIGNATKASIEVDFDMDVINKYLLSKNFTGKEYNQYLSKYLEFIERMNQQ